MTRTTTLVEKTPEERLNIYNLLLSSCTHLYSKNKLQEAKFNDVANTFIKLAKEDPMFMVHFTAWASKKDSKDLQILSIFFNSLNDAADHFSRDQTRTSQISGQRALHCCRI